MKQGLVGVFEETTTGVKMLYQIFIVYEYISHSTTHFVVQVEYLAFYFKQFLFVCVCLDCKKMKEIIGNFDFFLIHFLKVKIFSTIFFFFELAFLFIKIMRLN